MIFNNYEIPDNITVEDEFMYNLVNKLNGTYSNYGFVMGSFTGFIEHMKENNITEELIKEAEETFKQVESYLNIYNMEIYNMVEDRWKELGKPLSLEAHQAKKERLDKEDEYKDR